MMFAEQWQCPKCAFMNGFVRVRCVNCGEGRFHPDRDTNREIAQEIYENEKWNAKHGIKPETRDDTL